MTTTRRLTLATMFLLGGVTAAACSEDPPAEGTTGDGDGDGDTGDGDGDAPSGDTLKVLFTPMYSAYDGEHTFKVPVKVESITGVTFEASEEGFVDITPTEDGAMLTMLKAGEVDIIARAGNLTGRSHLTITAATPADYTLGETRYNNMMAAIDLDAGIPDMMLPDFNPNASCKNCHGEGADALDVEHTPQQIGGYSDDELITIFTEGKKPAGVGQRNPQIPAIIWSMIHHWTMSADEQKGIVVYIRSFEPKSQGPLDFGGIMQPDPPDLPTDDAGEPEPEPEDSGTTPDPDPDAGTGASDSGT